MKLRPLLILLLFVASTVILAWIYHAATHNRQPADKNPWHDNLADLDACCRRKHVKSVQYDHFADIANDEHYISAMRLFQAMALSERLQEHNCANAIVRLGGNYTPPLKIEVFHGTTGGNLARSIAYERRALGELHGGDIDRAVASGNRYAARALIWAAAGDMKHIDLMEHCLDGLNTQSPAAQTTASTSYVVCPECGNLYDTRYCDAYCPICLTDGRRFIRFE